MGYVMPELETIYIGNEERYITPVDESGLPYCFAPAKLPPVRSVPPLGPDGFHDRQADLNHMFPKYEVATSQSSALETPLARAALTGARVQWVDFEQHHEVYNYQFVGPEHPQNDAELFQTLTMATAGYVPEYALDLSGDEPEIIGLTNKQRKWLWTSGQVEVMCQSDVSKYLLDYVLQVDADHIKQRDVEEFLYTPDPDRRLELGHALCEQIIERAVEPVEEPYQEARKQDVLTFVRVGSAKKQAPETSRDLVKAKLRVGNRFEPVVNALQQRLAREPRRPFAEYVDDELAS
ncbi:MAG TPA: hypothetical protein VK983_05820 [Candidatus Limnocylindrales bacterium]|nr:hypothetical protein [Candidatus Limnocylindrales bacterium]